MPLAALVVTAAVAFVAGILVDRAVVAWTGR